MSHMFISTVGTTMSSLYRDSKDGEILGIIVENKHMIKWTRNKFILCNNTIQPRVFGV